MSPSLNKGVTPVTPLRFAYMDPPGPREYVIESLVPKHHTTSLFGDGGSAKSILALSHIIDRIAEMEEQELDRIQAAIDHRRGEGKLSTVLERREYRNGLLQLEGRAYRRKKDGELTERGPYWYFHYREGGKQRTLYVGKTDNPETKVNEIMKGEE